MTHPPTCRARGSVRRSPAAPGSLVAAVLLLAPWLMVLPSRGAGQTLPTSEDCVDCHLTLSDARLSAPARSYDNDIHAQTGFGCLACHGSGGSNVLDPARGFLSKPERREIPAMCGRCHSDGAFMRQFNPGLRTDQVSEYWTSVHGHRLREENDTSVATCVDCHPAHDIRRPTDPESSVYPTRVVDTCGRCHADPVRMAPYGISTNQVEEYKTSVHGQKLLMDGDVSAPVCNDCHGNHGAAPPGLASVRNVCGQCHSVMADFFDQSGHEEIFDRADMPGCVTCHGNHAIQLPADSLLGVKANELCAQCHAPSEAGGHAFQDIRRALDSLDSRVAEARSTLEDAENKGMEVSQALFELEDVTNAQTKARSAIHTFHLAPVLEEADPGFATAATAQERGEAALEDHRVRRVGLGVSAGIIVLLIASLFLKIHDVERRAGRAVEAVEGHFRRVVGGPGVPGRKEARLAASAILLEAAYTDDNLSGADRRFVEGVVRDRFGIPRGDADELIALLRRERSDAGRASRFAQLVGEELAPDQRDVILEELWKLVFSDETLAEHEVPIMDDLAKLLHVDRDVLAAARRRATATASGGHRSGMGEDR